MRVRNSHLPVEEDAGGDDEEHEDDAADDDGEQREHGDAVVFCEETEENMDTRKKTTPAQGTRKQI